MRNWKIYHFWVEEDPAATDNFFPTRKQAEEHAEAGYRGEKYTIEEITVEPTKAGICRALLWLPNR